MPLTPAQLQKKLLTWFADYGRHDLPWQKSISPYRVWLSEVMLQQTQVSTVIPYFKKFIKTFPSVKALALAPEDEVLHLWTGLGYYARARNLHKTAKLVHQDLNGKFPTTVEALEALPGIGRSTAGAIVSISQKTYAPILDGNVKRVLSRYFGIEGWYGETSVLKKLWETAEKYTPKKNCADYTQAIMDLGATVCTRSNPACEQCPFAKTCFSNKHNLQAILPTKKASKKIPTKETYFIILKNSRGEILLEQRPPSGIWGGLWSLPEISELTTLQSTVKKNFNLNIKSYEQLPAFKHTFSHYHLIINPIVVDIKHDPLKVMDGDQLLWYNVSQQQKIGLAAPVKKLLKSL